MRRSMLFLPGNNPNMLINANCLGADAVIFDLEDAVSPAEKDAARILVRNTMRYMDLKGCEVIVRINSVDTDYWKADIDAILPEKPNLILLPKTSIPNDVLVAIALISPKIVVTHRNDEFRFLYDIFIDDSLHRR